MARPLQRRKVGSSTFTSQTGTPPAQVISDGLPTGDELCGSLQLRYDGTLNVTGGAPAAVTDGPWLFMEGLTVETDKHGLLVENVDGKSLARIEQYRKGATPLKSADPATDASTFSAAYEIPFSQEYGYLRPYDAILDMRNSRMKVTANFGTPARLNTGATTTTVNSFTFNIGARVLNGPVNVGQPGPEYSELPVFMPHISMKRVPITATQSDFEIPIPFGDRIYRRIFLSQRNGSDYSEMTNVIAATAKISLKVANFPWYDRVSFQEIQSENKSDFQLETAPAGWAVLDFDRTGRFTDFLPALTRDQGEAKLVLDVTTQTNGQVWVIFESYKPIPEAAKR